jgi:2,4-dienoyl-CoA reductase-like NADH-dependent reductase (Old Yellow Enzyme family)
MTCALFTPLRLRGLELANRIAVSPMCMYAAKEGVATPFHWAHVGQLALGGAGLVILEATGVEPIARISQQCLGLWNDEQEEALARLVADVRGFSDTPLGLQLGHAGRKAACHPGWVKRGTQLTLEEGGWVGAAPSAEPWGDGWIVPEALDDAGMERVKQAFVQATRRADRAGFDLLEIHGAHGYLLNAFFSPLANFRTDRYGGSLENRMRFPLEVVGAMRAALSPDKPLGIRINGDDWHERGTTLDDAVTFARALREAGADYITPSAGNGVPKVRFPPVEPGYMTHFAERIRREAGVTTAAVGMIVTAQQADEIVASGRADLVMVARGVLDDPRWGLHAAVALGEPAHYPPAYAWAGPRGWRGYQIVHPAMA